MNLRSLAAVTALILVALCAGAAAQESNPYSAAAVGDHLAALRQTAGHDFTVQWEPPFAVAGDPGPGAVQFVATNTVRWATSRLKAEYFSRDPRHIIDIWLFKDDESYRRHARRLFHDNPTTPYGYYSPKDRALVMNISTGTGTLVHEMVHAFMGANFESCPAWFNEGLASLYEQCGEKSGRIHGYPNWRLPKLQEAIRAGTLPTFKQLTGTSADEFYGRTTNRAYNEQYAQARYLCYALQERGLLRDFFREFRDHIDTDPTGYISLRKTLGEKDMSVFQRKWEAEILLLHFP